MSWEYKTGNANHAEEVAYNEPATDSGVDRPKTPRAKQKKMTEPPAEKKTDLEITANALKELERRYLKKDEKKRAFIRFLLLRLRQPL